MFYLSGMFVKVKNSPNSPKKSIQILESLRIDTFAKGIVVNSLNINNLY